MLELEVGSPKRNNKSMMQRDTSESWLVKMFKYSFRKKSLAALPVVL